MRTVAIGIMVMLIGWGLLFAMVAERIESGIFRALVAYAAVFGGLLTSVFALARRARAHRHQR